MEPPDSHRDAADVIAGIASRSAGYQVADKLCVDCKHRRKVLGVSSDFARCERPGLPLNLVTGTRAFPAIIARGYEPLCGPEGLFWERR